jgi:hypothetical protein
MISRKTRVTPSSSQLLWLTAERELCSYCKIEFLMFSPIEVFGTVRDRPELELQSVSLSPKALAKLVFMQREDVERIILQHLSLGKSRLLLDEQTMIEVILISDIYPTKYKFSRIVSKMIVPEWMLTQT